MYNNDIVLITPFKYTDENYILLCNTIINIINLDIDFSNWYILVAEKSKLQYSQIEKIKNILSLTLHYDYNIQFIFSDYVHPAKLKGEFFNSHLYKYDNAYFISIDSDRIFDRNSFANLVFTLSQLNNGEYIIYPVIDYINTRNYDNYIRYVIKNKKVLDNIVNRYGNTILPYLKIKFNKFANLIPIDIGGPGFAIHSKSITQEIINFLLNFEENVRGHDILLAEFFDNKYLLTDCWSLHLGVNMSEYWQKYDDRVIQIFKKHKKEN